MSSDSTTTLFNGTTSKPDQIDTEEAAKKHKQFLLQNTLWARARKLKKHIQQKENDNEPSTSGMDPKTTSKQPTLTANKQHSAQKQSDSKNDDDEITIVELRCGKATVNAKKKKAEGDVVVEQKRVRIADEEEERMRNELLRKMATNVLIREAKRSAERAREYGPQGWIKPRSLSTNKIFLARTLQSVELDRRERDEKYIKINSKLNSHNNRHRMERKRKDE